MLIKFINIFIAVYLSKYKTEYSVLLQMNFDVLLCYTKINMAGETANSLIGIKVLDMENI